MWGAVCLKTFLLAKTSWNFSCSLKVFLQQVPSSASHIRVHSRSNKSRLSEKEWIWRRGEERKKKKGTHQCLLLCFVRIVPVEWDWAQFLPQNFYPHLSMKSKRQLVMLCNILLCNLALHTPDLKFSHIRPILSSHKTHPKKNRQCTSLSSTDIYKKFWQEIKRDKYFTVNQFSEK